MVDMLLAVIPAALAGSAILAFFWTMVMRINELESRTTATRTMQESMQETIQQAVQMETRSGVETVRAAMLKRITTIEEARQEDAARLAELTRNLEENATRQSRAVESMASMLSTLHAQMTEQEERMTALMDLRLTTAAQETADDLRRLEVALAGGGQAPKQTAAVAASA